MNARHVGTRSKVQLTSAVFSRLAVSNIYLSGQLHSQQLDITHISHVNVYLSSLSYFAPLNAAMYSVFGTSPPTRACVAVPLASNQRVRIDIVAHSNKKRDQRQALHVQSVSYWAPANIGPYSQSITVRNSIF